eukprot:symbB.v1.2.031726.t1/scaffold3703.1/size65852/5
MRAPILFSDGLLLKAIPRQPERELLPLARAALSAWRAARPGTTRVGVPPQVIFHFARYCIKHSEIHAAVAALLQFDLYARPSEILDISGVDLVRPVKSLSDTWGIILGNADRQRRTKTGDDLSNGMDLFFSGENLVGSICEASGELKHGMYVEIIRGEYRGYRGTVDISNGQFKVKLVNGTKLQVGEMYCRPLEEDVHWVEKEWQEEHLHGQRCEGLVDVERTCSKDGCTVLLAPEEVSCESFCEAHHLHCNEAWASHKDSCETSAPAPCAAKMSLRGEQLLCRCQPMTLSRLGQEVHLGAHVLLNSRAAVVTKVPDRHGHLEVETPELVTLNTPSFEPHNHSHGSESHTDSSKDHHASCEEVKQGEEVRFTAGKFKGHLGAMMSCDPVSQEYRVMLSQHIRVHAFDVRVVHCETLKYFGQSCSHDHCELAPSETADSCQDFCNGHDLRCLKAWIHDSHSDSSKRCAAKRTLVPCDHPGGLHNKLCECTPHVFVDDCFQKGVSFSPQNMEGQFRSHEPSASACAHRCASVVGCAHFSFWTDGGCHLQDVQGKMEERPGVTSGPPDCLAPSILATPVAADFSKTESSRCEEGISYRPLDMYGELRTKEPSLNDCALRCHRVDGCVHFSYWLDGGCHLQDGKASKKGTPHSVESSLHWRTLGAISGPANGCRQELESKGEVTEAVPVVPQRPRWSSDKPSPDLSPSNEAVTLSLARPCANLVDVQTLCSATQDSCKVMVHGMSRRSCFDYCEQQSLRCISTTSRCHGGEEVGCEIITGSNLMACHCEAPSHRNDAPEKGREKLVVWDDRRAGNSIVMEISLVGAERNDGGAAVSWKLVAKGCEVGNTPIALARPRSCGARTRKTCAADNKAFVRSAACDKDNKC